MSDRPSRNSLAKYFQTDANSNVNSAASNNRPGYGRFSLNSKLPNGQAKPILKKSTMPLVGGHLPEYSKQTRPASLGHSSAANRVSLDSKNNITEGAGVQKKRLSWGKSKVLEFYKDEKTSSNNNDSKKKHSQLQDYSKEPDRPVSCRDRRFRNSSQLQSAANQINPNSDLAQKNPILNVASEYEEALN